MSSKAIIVGEIDLFSEILSRLAIRLDDENLARAFKVATVLYKQAIERPNHTYKQSVSNLLSRCIEAFGYADLVNHLPEIASLPLPEADEEAFLPSEPFLKIERMDFHPKFENTAEWEPIKNLLFSYLSSDSKVQRGRAIVRLNKLSDWKLLSTSETSELGDKLWASVDEEGFPSDAPLYKYAVAGKILAPRALKFPAPRRRDEVGPLHAAGDHPWVWALMTSSTSFLSMSFTPVQAARMRA